MIEPWLGIVLVLGALGLMFGALKGLERWLHPHPELLRKLLHVGMGLIVVTFPWVFHQQWPVFLLASVSAGLLGMIKHVPQLRDGVGSVMTGVRRVSLGEICFPIGVAVVMLLSRGDKLLFAVPMLVIALADTMAALVGLVYGKVKYVTSDGIKSAEGSIAFFAVAFLSVHVPLLLFTDVARPQTLLIAAIIGVLATIIEAISAHGLDNLLIPLATCALLRLYLHASSHALLLRLGVTFLLMIFAISWRRRSTLDDSALMACALYGYGAAMLGGPLWLIGPAILFLVHVGRWPRFGPRRTHSVYAVASVTLAGLLWLGLRVSHGGDDRYLFPYAVGFGAHLAIIGVSRIAVDHTSQSLFVRVTYSVLAGAGLALLQIGAGVLVLGGYSAHHLVWMVLTTMVGVSVGALIFYLALPYLYGQNGSDAEIHSTGFAGGLIASIVSAGLLLIGAA